MAAGPVEDTAQQLVSKRTHPAQSLCQRRGFRLREVRELDAPPDVERGQPRIPDEVRGRCDAEQAEGELAQRRVLGAAVVAGADAGEELVRAERQRANGVDFIE